jgi:hypothetical protein
MAQWLNHPTPGIPRTPDGKPNLTASAPRTADGKPDLSGVWARDTRDLSQDLFSGMDPKDFPIRPWAAALSK